MRFTRYAATVALFCCIGKASAHEFWIDPVDFVVAPGSSLSADLRVGEEFVGPSYSYLPNNFERFEVYQGGAARAVEGRLGDTPALNIDAIEDGLAIVAHETTHSRLTYREWERFVRFADHKAFGDIAALHDGRGLPRDLFVESYSRHAKSLMAVGDGAGSDQEIGLETEIVALANPYTDDVSGGLPVQVFFRGEPRANAQVELFHRAVDGSVAITLHQTNAEGIAMLPVMAAHEYLADHVVLEAVEPESDGGPVWHTYWASLTFAVPE